jgi:peptide/nickel transport system permease protein
MSETGKRQGRRGQSSQPVLSQTAREGASLLLAFLLVPYRLVVAPIGRFFHWLGVPINKSINRHHLIVVWSVRRAINAVAQILGILTILYFFFDVLAPSASSNQSTVSIIAGWPTFVLNILTGQWGTIAIGGVVNIATVTYVSYYLPFSIELAALALFISLVVAYPLGLLSGWRRGRYLDAGVRSYTAVWLFFPALILAFFLIIYLYTPFINYSGDYLSSVFGTLPSTIWFETHGGIPNWVGSSFGNTSPTGFPLLDAAIHGDWTVEWLVFLKVLLEASCIAVSYVALFMRYARNATVEATKEAYIQAGRARGIPNSRLLWRHAGRRVIPLYVFTIGNTFGMFVVIQSTVELIFNTQGALYLLLEAGGQSLIGGGLQSEQALLIVLIFLISVVILIVSIVAEIVAMALDPAWLSEKEKGAS